jgi:L-rhamnose mutarotase
MADQDRNVKQWWEDRNNLVKTQNTRREGTRSLNEVLYADRPRRHAWLQPC